MKKINEILNQKIKEIQDEIEKRDTNDLTELDCFNTFLKLQEINNNIIKRIKNKKHSIDVEIYLEKNENSSNGYNFIFGKDDIKLIVSILSDEMWSKCDLIKTNTEYITHNKCFHICPICHRKLYVADYYFESCHGEYFLSDNYKEEKCDHIEYKRYNDKIYFISIQELIFKSKSFNREIKKQKISNIIVENHELTFNSLITTNSEKG